MAYTRYSIYAVARKNSCNSDFWRCAAGVGQYVEMSKTDKGAGNRARLISPYMNTTGRCLELYYWIRADDDYAAGGARNLTRLSIITVTEQLEESTLTHVTGSTVDFIRLFQPLPAGVHRIVVEGRRDSLNVECALSVDDLAVMDCARFGMSVLQSHVVCLSVCLSVCDVGGS